MKKHYLVSIFLLLLSPCLFSQAFVTHWKTNNPGSSPANAITIPASGSFDYEWVELGNPQNTGTGNGEGDTTISFPSEGNYSVSITPSGATPFHRIRFNNEGDKEKIISIEAWGAIPWSAMDFAFSGAANLEVNATDAPDLSRVTDMSGMFNLASKANPVVNHWDVSNVEVMTGVFSNAINFNQPLNDWNVSKVTEMSYMFFGTHSFNQPLDKWDVGKVTAMEGMFGENPVFNQNINSWNVENVTVTSGMFYHATDFNQPLNNWNMGNVKYIAGMFDTAVSFNQPLNDWNVSNVEVMATTFANTVAFNQPLDTWDVSKVWLLAETFRDAVGFNQSLETWQLTSLMVGDVMLTNSGIACDNYSLTIRGWAAQTNIASGINLGAHGLKFSPEVAAERQALIASKGWNFVGDSQGTCTLSVESNLLSGLEIYPNPASDVLHVKGLAGNETLSIFDSSGRMVYSGISGTTETTLHTGNFSEGIYYLKISNGEGKFQIKKLIIK